jgi:hypothetical protein
MTGCCRQSVLVSDSYFFVSACAIDHESCNRCSWVQTHCYGLTAFCYCFLLHFPR